MARFVPYARMQRDRFMRQEILRMLLAIIILRWTNQFFDHLLPISTYHVNLLIINNLFNQLVPARDDQSGALFIPANL